MSEAILTIMSPVEIESLTGYKQGTKQLSILRERGFNRAYIGRLGVILERAHYEAICAGAAQSHQKSANVAFLRKVA